ncbi:hypothetical protein DENSPDRAFT_853962 [Dentipellis sp. KUC8613]|nr:hypothetical protein DENSPDRAFT_853962 [Dentipellis sp. KUC8613]
MGCLINGRGRRGKYGILTPETKTKVDTEDMGGSKSDTLTTAYLHETAFNMPMVPCDNNHENAKYKEYVHKDWIESLELQIPQQCRLYPPPMASRISQAISALLSVPGAPRNVRRSIKELDQRKGRSAHSPPQRRKNDEVYASCLREAVKLWEQIEDSKRERQHISDGVQEAKWNMQANLQHMSAWEAEQVAEFRQQNNKIEQEINKCQQLTGICRAAAKELTRHTNAYDERCRLLRREARRVRDEAQSHHSGDQDQTGV